MNILVIDKAPSKTNYSRYFKFEYEQKHLSSVPIKKLLKKDIDIEVDLDSYNFVILVGAEASKVYAKVGVSTSLGILIDKKFLVLPNPAVLHFRPEAKPDFDMALDRIHKFISGELDPDIEDGDFEGIDDEDGAVALFTEIYNSDVEVVSIDTETSALYPRDGEVLGISISHKPKFGRYISSDVMSEEACDILQNILLKKEIVFHNMKFDIKMLQYHFNFVFHKVHDTMLMHYLLDENSSHSLKQLAIRYTRYGNYDQGLEDFKDNYCKLHKVKKADFTYDLVPFEIMYPYASKDAGATLELYHRFVQILDSRPKLRWVYDNIMIPGCLFLNEMEENGIPISKERLEKGKALLETEIAEATSKLYKFTEIEKFEKTEGIVFNPNSVIQLRKLLYWHLKLPKTGRMTATGADSTDAEALTELAVLHEIPKHILTIRQKTKILNTYIEKILLGLDRDGRIRTNFNQTFTTSGRLSSSGKFNAQQIVRDDPIVKGCIIAHDDYVIISQDLKTAEVYYAAVVSEDKALQDVFRSGEDLHSAIAHAVFNPQCSVKDLKKLYPNLRQAAKAITFGILYGAGPGSVQHSVSKETGESYSLEQAKEDIAAYFRRFNRLKNWLDERKDFIKQHGYTYSVFGRKRRLPNVKSPDKTLSSQSIRSGINMEIQSVASDVNLIAAVEMNKWIKDNNIDAKIFMLVHDSIVAEVHKDYVDVYKEKLKEITQKDRGVGISGTPIGVDQEVGNDYSFGHFDEIYRIESDTLSRVCAE